MKKICQLNVILLFLLCVYACNDDFMNKYPEDKVNDENFWKTVNDLQTYSNQFYPYLTYSINSMCWVKDDYSDNQAPASRNSYVWNEYPVPSAESNHADYPYRWTKNGWGFIRSCNYFLQRYHTVVGIPAEIERYVGEIRFFRALFYFQKVCRYGDVPWLSRDLNINSTELNMSRTPRKTVIDSVLLDLDYAIEKLPKTTSDERLTKYAALALKARVGLYEGTYMKYHSRGDGSSYLRTAADAANTIMSSGLFRLYKTATNDPQKNYRELFILDELKGNPEAIMYKRYILNKLMHNRVRELDGAANGFTKDFVETYLCTDGKPIGVSSLYKGESVTDYMQEFENRDPRMKQSIYTSDQPYLITPAGEIEYQKTPQFDNGLCFTGYRIFKFYSILQSDLEYERCTLDDIIFRYAEILLIYAEAKAELNECTQDDLDKSINLLRDRVGMPHLNVNVEFTDPNWPDWEVPVSALINEIRRERRVELAAEGFRFDDLARWKAGKLLNNVKTYVGALDPGTGNYRVLYAGQTRTWNDKLYLYPIPSQELAVNPSFKPQNPGWE